MQFRSSFLVAAVVLATSAAASIEGSSSDLHVRSASGLKAAHAVHLDQRAASTKKHAGSAEERTRKGIKRIESDIKLLQILKGNKEVTAEMERPIIKDLQKHTASASAALQDVLKSYSTAKRATVEPTVKELVVDLNHVLCKVNKLVKELVKNTTGSNKLNEDLVIPLGKTLGQAVKALEGKLLDLAPELGKLIDPVLNEVASDLNFLGIHLRSVDAAEENNNADLVARKAVASSEAALEAEIQAHLNTVTHDLAKLEKLKVSGKLDSPAAKKLLKQVFADASAASKSVSAVIKQAHASSAKAGKAKGKKRADGGAEGIFGTLLYRLVHDLVCVLHAVIKLSVDLLGNLGLKDVKELVKELDDKALEPLFDGLKDFSKQLGNGLSPDLDPLLSNVQGLLAKIGLA
ncbi:hypothetical protein OC834_004272 [Tilletia horrida]|nr:hypothetical protein OC834_004272 [Tilletia horrida]